MPNALLYRLPHDEKRYIIAVESGPVMTWCYLCVDDVSKTAILFDAPFGSLQVIDEVLTEYELTLKALYLTHSHWDHTAEASMYAKQCSVPVYIHPDDEYRLLKPMDYTVWKLPFEIEPINSAQKISTEETVALGAWLFGIKHVPGHTEGSICFYDKDAGILIAGDTLFAGSIGRTDLEGGNHELLLSSIKKELLSLEDKTIVLSGHGEATTIGHERQYNPYVGESVLTEYEL